MMLSRVRSLWRNLTRRRHVETDLDAELQSYVDALWQDVRFGIRSLIKTPCADRHCGLLTRHRHCRERIPV